jgi:hypothetical protein
MHQDEPVEPCALAVLPKPARELVDRTDELLSAVDFVAPELPPRKPEPALLPDWLGWQAGEPGTVGPQFWATGPRKNGLDIPQSRGRAPRPPTPPIAGAQE